MTDPLEAKVNVDEWLRFWSKVDKNGLVSVNRPELGRCWNWLAQISNKGYGQFKLTRSRTSRPAHRWSYQYIVGPIPMGLILDHLCRNRCCVNPAHLEPVTNRENVLRGFSPLAQAARSPLCKYGHPFDKTVNRHGKRYNGKSYRRCSICQAVSEEKYAKSIGR